MVALLGPSMAVYATDILRRRNRYDGPGLCDETPAGPFWYRSGINWAGVTALCAGTAVSTLSLATTLFSGPIAAVLGGVDLSLATGILVTSGVYAGLMRGRSR
ncbi:cytosine permease [Kitasatospora sp. NPDC002227]|uniref:cytosine permease n=1 Tax=Kitasatospora sp. NPDC002227 TaxID=3154773 RepID=UPI0033313596